MKTELKPNRPKPAKDPTPPTRNLLVERLAPGQSKLSAAVLHRILRRK